MYLGVVVSSETEKKPCRKFVEKKNYILQNQNKRRESGGRFFSTFAFRPRCFFFIVLLDAHDSNIDLEIALHKMAKRLGINHSGSGGSPPGDKHSVAP